MNEAPTLAAVVGENAQRLRGGNNMDAVAVAARRLGLRWDTSRVSALERGEVSPTLPTLLALCMALSDVAQQEVALADLVDHRGDIRLTDKLVLPASAVADALRGEPADLRASPDESFDDAIVRTAIAQAGGEAEQRAAQSLGIGGRRFIALAQALWGRTYAEERDSRSGPDANAQKRGRVSRDMKAEMRKALDGND